VVPPRPHPFLWLFAAALLLGVVAAAFAPSRSPAIALYWNPVYRAEIGALAAMTSSSSRT